MKQRTQIQEGQHYEKIYGLPGFRSGWEVRSIADQVASLPHAVLVNLNDPRDVRTISCLTIAGPLYFKLVSQPQQSPFEWG